jgi:hypothetical protein
MWRFAALHLFARVIALGAARLGGFDRLAVDDDDGGRRVFSCRLKEARMTIEENKAAVRRHLEDAWNRNKVTELEEYVSPDHVHYSGKKVETRSSPRTSVRPAIAARTAMTSPAPSNQILAVNQKTSPLNQ